MHSQAKVVGVDKDWEGPCRRESKVHVFNAHFEWYQDCMHHCQKISGGRSPPVRNRQEWDNFTREIDLITHDRSIFPYLWISATEGDQDLRLATLDHWNEMEVVRGENITMKAIETVWRDFYDGERLDNWTKPNCKECKNDTLYD